MTDVVDSNGIIPVISGKRKKLVITSDSEGSDQIDLNSEPKDGDDTKSANKEEPESTKNGHKSKTTSKEKKK